MSSRHIRGKMKLSTNYTVTSGDYTIVNESLVVVDKTSGAATALTLPIPVDGQCIFIKDGKGDAATNNITISPDGATATTIDGAATYVISENYGSVMLEYDTTQAEWGVLSTGRSVADAELALLNGVTAGTGAVSKVMSLNSSGDYFGPNNGGIVVGHTAQLTVAGVVPELQVLGTTTAVDGSMALVTASTTNTSESQLVIGKGGNAALGSFTTVAQGENLGSIAWVGDDGVDLATVAARIRAVVNSSGTVAASRVPTDLVFYTDPGGADDAIAEQMRLGCGGLLLVNDTSHAGMTKGVCINQGAADDIAFALKSSDVATVLTTIVTGTVETDDYFTISKFAAATGGALIQALGENAAVTTNLRIESYGGQADATKSASGRGLIEMYATQHDGANALADIGADGNALCVIGRRGSADATLFIVDEDGEIHSDVAAATYDEHDDLALVRAFDHGKRGFVANAWDSYVNVNEQSLIDIGVLGAPRSEGGLVNHCRLLQLHNGALWQLFSDVMDVVAALPGEVLAKLPERIRSRVAAIGQREE